MSSQGRTCPVAIEDPHPVIVEKVLKEHHAREERRHKDRQERTLITKWCSCGACGKFATVHENVCCRELVEEVDGIRISRQLREIFLRVREKMLSVDALCITQHPPFHKVVLDSEVLSVWVERRRFERQKKDRDMPKEDTSRIYRYYAYRSFVSWAYGILGMGKRYELPACVRVAIMNAYPSGNAEYVGFK
ncbi:hypothetical protein OSTOST_14898, partial [Ostertagia ostertagi]